MALDLAQLERTLHLPLSPPPAEREKEKDKREREKRRKKKKKLHYYNIIILLDIRLTTSKLAMLHSGRRRQGNNREQHSEAVVMCAETFLIHISAFVRS